MRSLKRFGVLVVLGMVFCTILVKPVQARFVISDDLLQKYSAYDIFFYNAEQSCEPGTTIPGQGGGPPFTGGAEKWNGACTPLSAARASWLRGQINGMQSAATANGLPWEMIAGQVLMESGGGRAEVCPYNPLGLKAKRGWPSCNGIFASFNNYQEAYQYYVDSIIPIRAAKGKHPNDPYSAIAYIQYGTTPAYAVCDGLGTFPNCAGHAGEPTPGYVQNTSSLICGIQKWAKSEGIAISAVTWENYGTGGGSGESGESGPGESGSGGESESGGGESNESPDTQITTGTSAVYCGADGTPSGTGADTPEAGNLVDFIKKWAWPDYKGRGFMDKMPAYNEYINSQATYKGGCDGVDCGAFVANIMKASGWDPNYVQGSTYYQQTYLASNWNRVSTDSLQLGDVGIKPGHVIMYVGNIDGFNSRTASASLCSRAPMAGADSNLSIYTWYRRR